MNRTAIAIIYLLVMIGTIVGIDLAFLRGDAGLRLVVNICIVMVFATVYLLVIRRL